ncbi:MAG: hypothetical protein JSS02_18240 [Planctomycetes bacterium]|nr:hypothetical protein [Planctomycetota bacterium]
MSPELETLDQLQGRDLSPTVIQPLFKDREHFLRAMRAMLETGDIRLVEADGAEAPRARWSQLLSVESGARLLLTSAGARRIG